MKHCRYPLSFTIQVQLPQNHQIHGRQHRDDWGRSSHQGKKLA
uniref:Uncharacterized protein n=1 Tax=Arundo donax TaxID=35708 RepID=A0A0A9BRD2_ARUDO